MFTSTLNYAKPHSQIDSHRAQPGHKFCSSVIHYPCQAISAAEEGEYSEQVDGLHSVWLRRDVGDPKKQKYLVGH